ncbi:MAG: response regulator [Candidatus Zixiibacteriota bacterium]
MAIISIVSGVCCHGNEVASLTAEAMGYTRIDDSLYTEASKRFNIPRDKFNQALSGRVSLFNKFTREREKHIAGFKKIMTDLILDDNILMHGFASSLIPGSISHALRVCLIANWDYRIKRAAKRFNDSVDEAEKFLTESDRLLYNWTTFLHNKRPFDAKLYDIVIPMHETSVEDAAALIENHALSEPLKTTEHSLKSLRDFIRATEINLLLVEAGYDVEVEVIDSLAILTIQTPVTRLKVFREKISNIAASVDGIQDVRTQLGDGFNYPSINPMSRVTTPDRILICENEQEFIHTLSERLRAADLKSSVVYDGQQAIDVANKEEPAVMVLDLMMPGIDGINTLRTIRESHPDIRVIILTKDYDPEEEKKSLELGAYAYLKKPVNVDKMARIMKTAYQEASLERAARHRNHL